MFKKIVCPIDFSPGSEQALQFAARMATDLDADLVVAHVWYVPPLAYSSETMPPAGWDAVRDSSERMLAEAKQRAVGLGAPRVSTLLLSGVPWAQIAEIPTDPDVDLVVIGTHGRTGISRFLLGSVAEQVVRHADCSVIVARGEYKGLQHVLCSVDFSDSSHQAMRRAGELARESVTLFHAIEIPALFGLEPSRSDEAFDLDRRAQRLTEAWGSELGAMTRASVSTRTAFGSPAAETLAMLDADPKLDLVVVGSHGRTGIRRVLLGSVAEKIVRHARTPVLVARARG
ncbi:MAG: universal stress protein [Acidobacteriota bacterium]